MNRRLALIVVLFVWCVPAFGMCRLQPLQQNVTISGDQAGVLFLQYRAQCDQPTEAVFRVNAPADGRVRLESPDRALEGRVVINGQPPGDGWKTTLDANGEVITVQLTIHGTDKRFPVGQYTWEVDPTLDTF